VYVENQLVAAVKARVHAYQLQDLKCVKCQQIKVGHVAGSCKCAGKFVVTQDPAAMARWLRIFQSIARWHSFELLDDTVSWLLQHTVTQEKASVFA